MTYQCSKVSTADMFIAFLVISHLTLISVGNPIHKYPYVFLLDVGNEELEKTNTEQIRLSIPGGSLAIRYPAIGNVDTIGHLRVSGVDFGTDLKSSIVEGGPGYKYVVLAFVGNPGVPYDVIVTVQTVAEDNSYSVQNFETQDMNTERNVYQVEDNSKPVNEDENNSAEDLSDDFNTSETKYSEKTNSEIVQLSSDAYKYAQNEVNNEDDDDDDDDDADDNDDDEEEDEDDDNDNNLKDIHKQYIENPKSNLYNEVNTEQDTRDKDYIEQKNDEVEQNQDQNDETDDQNDESSDQNNEERNSKVEKSASEDFEGDELDSENEAVRYVDRNLYNKYKVLQPHLFSGVKIYPQDNQVPSEKTVHDDPTEIDQMFNDEEIHTDGEKYTDSNNNNNYFDSDDSSAVAY